MSNTLERFVFWPACAVITILINAPLLMLAAWIIPGIEFVGTATTMFTKHFKMVCCPICSK